LLGQLGRDELMGRRLLRDDGLELAEVEGADVELAGVEQGEDLVRDLLGMRIADLPYASEIDPVDDQLAVVAAQDVVTLAADAQDFYRLAVLLQALDVLPRQAGYAGVETAAQPALGGHDDEEMDLIAAGADEQWREPFPAGDPSIEVGEDAVHAIGIGPRRGRCLLRAAQLGRRHHLHGP